MPAACFSDSEEKTEPEPQPQPTISQTASDAGNGKPHTMDAGVVSPPDDAGVLRPMTDSGTLGYPDSGVHLDSGNSFPNWFI